MKVAHLPGWFRNNLTGDQLAPLGRQTRHACIFASAGSGKTRTLVHMVAADLLAGVPPNEIIAFTFTEKAANELLARIHGVAAKYLPGTSLAGMYVGTIHGWCLQYLRRQPAFLNLEAVDELQLATLISRLYDQLNLNQIYSTTFPRGIKPFTADLEIYYNEHLSARDVPDAIRPALEQLIGTLADNRLLTFGGMIRNATETLCRETRPQIARIYVDEYQDVNPSQVALIRRMIGNDTEVVAVGDDLQCIYQWRGSDVHRILSFEEDFPDSSFFRLATNYRSLPTIVALSNSVASHVVVRDRVKEMIPARQREACSAVHWVTTESEEQQAQAVVKLVQSTLDAGVKENQVAVLLRSVTGAGRSIVNALREAGVRVNCPPLSRGRHFIDSFVLPLMDWLSTEPCEPKNELEEAENERAAASLLDAIALWSDPSVQIADIASALGTWTTKVRHAKSDAYNVRQCLYEFCEQCGIRVHSESGDILIAFGIATQIIRSVEEIHRRRLRGTPRRTPRGLLREIAGSLRYRQDEFGESLPLDVGAEGVVVCTVHQSKGLEWPVVIIPTLMRNGFPTTTRRHGSSYPDAIAARYGTSPDDERRLFYVACTRAKDRLFLLDFAGGQPATRSGFLNDLAVDLQLQPASLKKASASSAHLDLSNLGVADAPPLRIGLSDLLLFLECPFQFGLRRITRIQPAVGDDLGYGKGLHELIQRRLTEGTTWDINKITDQAAQFVRIPLASESTEQQLRTAIVQRLSMLESLGELNAKVECELEVDVRLGDAIIHGIIDAVEVHDNGGVRLRDWKSNVHAELFPRYERQLQFYAHALTQMGRTVIGAELVDAGATVTSKKLIAVPIDHSPAARAHLLTVLEASIEAIVGGNFAPTPSEAACGACDMRTLCTYRISR